MSLSLNTTARLNNGIFIPRFGLGVYQSGKGDETRNAVGYALKAGYRHIDTAMIYGNEKDVGIALHESEISREDVFVTTKLWNSDHGYDSTLAALEKSLGKLGLDHIDLYLIHWPVPKLRLDTWRAMETLLSSGKCRSIGVSNYMVRHLEELMSACTVPPAVNQIEMSPYIFRHRDSVVDFCKRKGIVVEAYSPLTKGERLNDPRLGAMAGRYNKTPAQILIRWCLQRDFVVIPKSSNEQRIIENADIYDFAISDEDMHALDDFDEKLVTSWDPTDAP